jgi:hypothetical protein
MSWTEIVYAQLRDSLRHASVMAEVDLEYAMRGVSLEFTPEYRIARAAEQVASLANAVLTLREMMERK